MAHPKLQTLLLFSFDYNVGLPSDLSRCTAEFDILCVDKLERFWGWTLLGYPTWEWQAYGAVN
jgi:hypothetical protein